MLRFLDTRLEEMLGALLLAVMVTIAFVNVVVRYCTPFSSGSSCSVRPALSVTAAIWA